MESRWPGTHIPVPVDSIARGQEGDPLLRSARSTPDRRTEVAPAGRERIGLHSLLTVGEDAGRPARRGEQRRDARPSGSPVVERLFKERLHRSRRAIRQYQSNNLAALPGSEARIPVQMHASDFQTTHHTHRHRARYHSVVIMLRQQQQLTMPSRSRSSRAMRVAVAAVLTTR